MRGNRYPSFYDSSVNDETLDNELATDKVDGLMSKEDKVKLDSIQLGEDGSLTPIIKAENVIETEDKQFVTVEQINKWEAFTNSQYDPDSETLVIG